MAQGYKNYSMYSLVKYLKLIVIQTFLKRYVLNYIIFFPFVITIELINFYDTFFFYLGVLALDNHELQEQAKRGSVLTPVFLFMNIYTLAE